MKMIQKHSHTHMQRNMHPDCSAAVYADWLNRQEEEQPPRNQSAGTGGGCGGPGILAKLQYTSFEVLFLTPAI